MAVLERSELEASSLADLHAIADQVGLEGFRRMRKADLIDAILAGPGGSVGEGSGGERPAQEGEGPPGGGAGGEGPPGEGAGGEGAGGGEEARAGPPRRRGVRARRPRKGAAAQAQDGDAQAPAERPAEARAGEGGGGARSAPVERRGAGKDAIATGVIELLGNGSAFLRVDPTGPADDDVYVSAAQVRRCELVSGDRVSGPLRAARRSERHPSLVRIERINGSPAGEVAEGPHYEERPVAYPSERLALDGGDPALEAIEWLTPFGRGSRAVIVGPARAGKTELLKRLLGVLAGRYSNGRGREDLQVTLVLTGVRPEEIAEWGEDPVAPAVALSFAATADAQSQALERALDTARRTAARGGDALVAIDTLDGLHPHTARRALAAARNLRDGGSLTIVATATKPFGGETTVIALDPALAAAPAGGAEGAPPLDLAASGTVRAELLVGDEGAAAIAKARANALAHAHGG